MTDRPIMFSAPMVRALLEGRKNMTRRLATSPLRKCVPGDRLWVRETFADVRKVFSGIDVLYRADHPEKMEGDGKWTPCIHMPRWASRLTLRVTETRLQRLHDISYADAEAEGLDFVDGTWGVKGVACSWNGDARLAFAGLWYSLHGVESWNANPTVIALGFTVERQNIDALPAAA